MPAVALWPSPALPIQPVDPTSQGSLWADLRDAGPWSEIETFTGVRGQAYTNVSGLSDGGGNGTGTWNYDDATGRGLSGSSTLLNATTSSAFNRFLTIAGGLTTQIHVTATFSASVVPSGADITVINLKPGNAGTVRAGLKVTTAGKLRIDNGTSQVFVFATTVTGGQLWTVNWSVVAGVGQRAFLYDQNGTLVESSTLVAFTSNQVDTVNFGAVAAWGVPVVMRWARVGYHTGIPFGPPAQLVPDVPVAWPYLPAPGPGPEQPATPTLFTPWWLSDQAAVSLAGNTDTGAPALLVRACPPGLSTAGTVTTAAPALLPAMTLPGSSASQLLSTGAPALIVALAAATTSTASTTSAGAPGLITITAASAATALGATSAGAPALVTALTPPGTSGSAQLSSGAPALITMTAPVASSALGATSTGAAALVLVPARPGISAGGLTTTASPALLPISGLSAVSTSGTVSAGAPAVLTALAPPGSSASPLTSSGGPAMVPVLVGQGTGVLLTKITPRPNDGTTPRPNHGITARTSSGITARTSSGITPRPNDGTTNRP